MKPFALDTLSRGTNSGTIPNLEGPKRDSCVPRRNITTKDPHLLSKAKAASPNITVNNSKILVETITFRLLKRSANIPAEGENKRNGSTKIAFVLDSTL